jgi:hypothetical protein
MAGGINALAAVTILDVLNPLYTKRTGNKQFPARQLVILFKGLGQFERLYFASATGIGGDCTNTIGHS